MWGAFSCSKKEQQQQHSKSKAVVPHLGNTSEPSGGGLVQQIGGSPQSVTWRAGGPEQLQFPGGADPGPVGTTAQKQSPMHR